jgi:L-methionine (R)-S-oxide reductase
LSSSHFIQKILKSSKIGIKLNLPKSKNVSLLQHIFTSTSSSLSSKSINMAEDLTIIKGSKEEQYENLLPQIISLVEEEPDVIANMSNICAALKQQFNWLWVGFYIVKGGELVLGPFQGPIACTRIKKGKGVCGSAWEEEKTIIVPDVEEFPGHIACSSDSKSEIVIPLFNTNNEVMAVLDIDSSTLDTFDTIDEKYLQKITALI